MSARKRQQDLARKQRAADVEAVMATPEGRRFVWGLLAQCNVWGRARGDFAEGIREAGVSLMEEVQRPRNSALYWTMLAEAGHQSVQDRSTASAESVPEGADSQG